MLAFHYKLCVWHLSLFEHFNGYNLPQLCVRRKTTVETRFNVTENASAKAKLAAIGQLDPDLDSDKVINDP